MTNLYIFSIVITILLFIENNFETLPIKSSLANGNTITLNLQTTTVTPSVSLIFKSYSQLLNCILNSIEHTYNFSPSSTQLWNGSLTKISWQSFKTNFILNQRTDGRLKKSVFYYSVCAFFFLLLYIIIFALLLFVCFSCSSTTFSYGTLKETSFFGNYFRRTQSKCAIKKSKFCRKHKLKAWQTDFWL